MKKMFKILSAAFVVAVTFVSAGCSCKLSDEKVIEKVRALESTCLYGIGEEDYQDFDMIIIGNRDNKEHKTKVQARMEEDKTYYTYYVDGKKESEDIGGHAQNETGINKYYDSFKDQPIHSYGKMTNGKYRELIGLEEATDEYLSIENIQVSAKKKLFKDEVTFVIEYRVGVRENYRQTITINSDNKITYAKLENIVTTVLNGKGDTNVITTTVTEVTIEYK